MFHFCDQGSIEQNLTMERHRQILLLLIVYCYNISPHDNYWTANKRSSDGLYFYKNSGNNEINTDLDNKCQASGRNRLLYLHRRITLAHYYQITNEINLSHWNNRILAFAFWQDIWFLILDLQQVFKPHNFPVHCPENWANAHKNRAADSQLLAIFTTQNFDKICNSSCVNTSQV